MIVKILQHTSSSSSFFFLFLGDSDCETSASAARFFELDCEALLVGVLGSDLGSLFTDGVDLLCLSEAVPLLDDFFELLTGSGFVFLDDGVVAGSDFIFLADDGASLGSLFTLPVFESFPLVCGVSFLASDLGVLVMLVLLDDLLALPLLVFSCLMLADEDEADAGVSFFLEDDETSLTEFCFDW